MLTFDSPSLSSAFCRLKTQLAYSRELRFYRILYKERKRTDVENMEEKNILYQKKKGRTHREMQKEGTFGWGISVTSLHVYEMGFWVGAMYCES